MQKIIVQNFGAINYAEIDIKNITILIGEQATGKSTIAQLVYFFKSLQRDITQDIYRDLENILFQQTYIQRSNIVYQTIIQSIQNKFRVYFGSTRYLSDNFDVKFYFSDTAENHIHLYKNNTLRITFGNNFDINGLKGKITNLIDSFKTINFIRQNAAIVLPQLETLLVNYFEENGRSHFFESAYIPAGRNITTGYSDLFQDYFQKNYQLYEYKQNKEKETKSVIMELLNSFMTLVTEINSEIVANGGTLQKYISISQHKFTNRPEIVDFMEKIGLILKAKYLIERRNNTYEEYLELPNHAKIALNQTSSGQQEAIRILQDLFLITANKKNTYRIIEEPEAHLFPTAQKNLVDLFAIATNISESKFFITTHSPYILSSFNNLLLAGQAAAVNTEQTTNAGYPSYLCLNTNQFSAYQMNEDGTITPILENGLINVNGMDGVSFELGVKLDQLWDIANPQNEN